MSNDSEKVYNQFHLLQQEALLNKKFQNPGKERYEYSIKDQVLYQKQGAPLTPIPSNNL